MAFGDLPMNAPLKPNKGLEGGACNRQSCQVEPADYYNHGSGKWYCVDCARDIGEDWVNKRDWELNWRPQKGHAMFETRAEIDERLVRESKVEAQDRENRLDDLYQDLFVRKYPNNPACRPKVKSSSLERLLRKRK